MADVVGTITGAAEIYRANWRRIIAPFAVLALLGLVFGIATFGMGMVSEGVCRSTNDQYVLIAFCYVPQIMQNIISIAQELVSFIVIMAVLVPLWALANKKPMTSWTEQVGKQFFNALKVIVVRLVIMLVVFSPVIVFIALNMAAIIAVAESMPAGADPNMVLVAVAGALGMILVMAALSMVLGILVNFFLTFFEIEVAVGGRGVFAAIGASVNMVLANFVDAFVFNLAWWAVGIGISVVVMLLACTVCLIPLAFLIPPLVVVPVMWLSKLLLWKEFGGGKALGRAMR